MNPLMLAVAKGYEEIVDVLIKNKSMDINMRDPMTGVNALWLASYYDQAEIMRVLAKNGGDMSVTNKQGINVMHIAVYKNHIELVKMLIKSGFPITNTTNDHNFALYIAI